MRTEKVSDWSKIGACIFLILIFQIDCILPDYNLKATLSLSHRITEIQNCQEFWVCKPIPFLIRSVLLW